MERVQKAVSQVMVRGGEIENSKNVIPIDVHIKRTLLRTVVSTSVSPLTNDSFLSTTRILSSVINFILVT